MKVMTEKDYGYKYPIKARYCGEDIYVRKMRKGEMPDDGNVYYVEECGRIFSHDAYPKDREKFELIEN